MPQQRPTLQQKRLTTDHYRDRTDGAHGRRNSSAQALWELHPVYWVKQP